MLSFSCLIGGSSKGDSATGCSSATAPRVEASADCVAGRAEADLVRLLGGILEDVFHMIPEFAALESRRLAGTSQLDECVKAGKDGEMVGTKFKASEELKTR